MKKLFLTLCASVSLAMTVQAQTARVMAIHNSADPAVDTVDVFLLVNGVQAAKIENIGFREGTGFLDVPSGVPVRLAFAPKTSTSLADTLIGFGYNLAANQTYVLLAEGHVAGGFNPQQGFNLQLVAPAFERNNTGGDSTVLAIVHGSTDAPAVDIEVRLGNDEVLAVEALAYGSNTGYVKVKENNYFVDVYPAGADDPLLTYSAPLAALNAGDSALVVFASGFLNPAQNKNGAAFGIFAALSNGDVIPLPVQTTFRIQAFHNCADVIADTVDVWLINRTTGQNTPLIPGFSFREATPFINAPANQDIALGVTLPGAPLRDTVYVEEIGKVPGGVTVIAVASGVLDPDNFEANPSAEDINFKIALMLGLERSAVTGQTALQVFHGSTDAPAVDVRARGVGVLFGDLVYSTTGDDYNQVPSQSYSIDITPAGATTALASYTAPLNNFVDSAVVVFASGFFSPNTPTGKDLGPGFALIAVTPGGRAISLPTLSTSVKQINMNELGVTMYPNPAREFVSFDVAEGKQVSVKVTDLSGKLVLENTMSNNSQMDISSLSKGMYVVRVTNDAATATQKLLVE